jgi:hypothetical protein
VKTSTKVIEVLFDNVPTFLDEVSVETIWTRGFI